MEFLKAGSLAFLNCPLYAYLERPDSAVRQKPSLRFYTAALAWERVWQLAKEQPDPFRSTTDQRCIMSCAEVYFRLVNQPERDPEKEKHCWSWLPRTATLRGRSRRSTKARSCRR